MSTALESQTFDQTSPVGRGEVNESPLIPYEQRLDQNPRWALTEDSIF